MLGKITMLIVASSLLSGCIVIPLPHNEHPESRDNSFISTGQRLEEGVATRRDVLLALGEPDEASTNELDFHYFYKADTGVWIVFIPPAYADGDIKKTDRCYLAEFNESAVLVSFGEHKH